MSFRTVVVQSKAKISFKNDYVVIRNEKEVKSVHVSEIGTLIIDTTLASLTTHLLCEISRQKIKIIFCDEKHNPYGELIPYYGSVRTSKLILMQVNWDEKAKGKIWKSIIKEKIINQSYLLRKTNSEKVNLLLEYASQVEFNDITNREGHAAKVYFNSLFGKNFSRNQHNDINAALNYGYAILLSTINKEICNNGYITQLGIKHRNQFNPFNLGSDLIEPFRILIDDFVYYNKERKFDKNYKYDLINLLNQKYSYRNKKYFVTDILRMYIKNVFDCLNDFKNVKKKGFNLYEGTIYEDNSIF